MGRVAVISDIHGNLAALNAVLECIDECGIAEIVCLGDIVGYGPNPRECVEVTLARCQTVVRGNHDDGVLDRAQLGDFNGMARTALLWTRAALLRSHLERIAALPLRAHLFGAVMCVHDSPQPGTAAYVHDVRAAAFAFRGLDSGICLLGHTHVPMVFSTQSLFPDDPLTPGDVDARLLRDGDVVELDPGSRYILNPGSVGQPRDSDPRASFGILDLDDATFRLRRAPYDIAATQQAALAAGLPAPLSQRLAIGA